MSKERMRNEDARGGDVIVNDSVASGKPDLPIDRDPGRETNVAISSDDLRGGEEPDLSSSDVGETEDERYEQKEELRGHGRKRDTGAPELSGPSGSRNDD
jgi:hypothetical protein